jgi:hypothetical protein
MPAYRQPNHSHKGNTMNDALMLPQLQTKGVAFRLQVDGREADCLILREALEILSELKDTNPDPLEVFYASQPAIHQIALRLVRSGVEDTPLVIGLESMAA